MRTPEAPNGSNAGRAPERAPRSIQAPSTARRATRPGSLLAGSAAVLAAGLAGCGGSSSSDGGGSDLILRLNEVSNGFGQLLPHLVEELDANGNPTGELIAIRSLADIVENVRRTNPILPSQTFNPSAIEPNGSVGNHYIYANFTQPLRVSTVLNASPTGGALAGAVTVTESDPFTGASVASSGRAFVGGKTLVAAPAGSGSSQNVLEQWVHWDSGLGMLVADVPEAEGFPGVGIPDPNLRVLVSNATVVFVRDTDNDLDTAETFPTGVQIRLKASSALLSDKGEALESSVLASSTVGADTLPPEIIITPAPAEAPLISPGNGDIEVDPNTTIRFEFTEPIQPYSLGPIGSIAATLDDEGVAGEVAATSSAMTMIFGEAPYTTSVPFTLRPASPYDLSTMVVTPAFPFPGRGPELGECGVFSLVNIALNTQQIEDFALNLNTRAASTTFETGEGIGVANVPVLPDAIYVGRGGASPAVSVVDLNGFGQSTGNPVSSQPYPLKGESRFPFDQNVSLNPTVRPLLRPGECTVDGGSAGAFTLTLDSGLSDLLLRSPLISQATDIHLGHSLDSSITNAPPNVGCQSSGGYICASDGVKVVAPSSGNQPNTLSPGQANQLTGLNPGYENLVCWAPHPNPPKINFPPLCVTPFIPSQEPTSVDSTNNLLVTGNPFPIPATNTPPTGLVSIEQAQFFQGPTVGGELLSQCTPYQIRQQIGQYLYIADRPRSEIVVVNSNRMTVMDRIPVADPTSMAVGPNLDLLAVTNQLADTVTFIDIDPISTQFHQPIKTVQVGNSPRGIAFDGLNEDILVCNELDSSISIIAAGDLEVRRTVSSQLNRPFELSVTPRMLGFSYARSIYFAYILNRSGNVALFESGPNGLNGWGFDDIVGIIPFDFQAPKTVQLDPIHLEASVYIVHEGPIDLATGQAGDLGDGAISRLQIESGPSGAVPITISNLGNPNFRNSEFNVLVSISQSSGQLSGIPLDIAFDDMRNVSGGPTDQNTNFYSAGSAIPANNKSQIRLPGPATVQFWAQVFNTNEPQFMFASIPNPVGGEGVIDVLNLRASGTPRFDVDPYLNGVQSIPVPDVTVLSDFFRQ